MHVSFLETKVVLQDRLRFLSKGIKTIRIVYLQIDLHTTLPVSMMFISEMWGTNCMLQEISVSFYCFAIIIYLADYSL